MWFVGIREAVKKGRIHVSNERDRPSLTLPAAQTIVDVLESFGWPPARVLDLGELAAARGMEMYLPLWLRLFRAMGTARINIGVMRET